VTFLTEKSLEEALAEVRKIVKESGARITSEAKHFWGFAPSDPVEREKYLENVRKLMSK
tara:strand:+ start:2169 stop:2345 length:177 start_codon:yes stop_codon:yes gene_type:complete